MDKLKLNREQLKEKILERSRQIRSRYDISKQEQESDSGGNIFKKLIISIVIVLAIILIKNIDTPFTQNITNGIKSVITSSFDIKNSIGKLKFVERVFPDFTERISQVFNEEEKIQSSDYQNSTEQLEEKQVSSDINIEFIAPLEGSLKRKFGKSKHPIYQKEVMNYGIDIAGDTGSPVIAVYDGEVIETGNNKEYKKYVKIKHRENIYTLYSNCSNILVKQGDIVKQADIIGDIGENSYLHFEVIVNGQRLDPLKFISSENKIIN